MWHFAASPLARNAGSAAVALAWLLLSAIFFLLLSSLGRVDGVPAFLVVVVALLAVISGWRPTVGLLIVITAVPVATWLGIGWHGGVPWPEVFVVAFVAGYAARQASPRYRDRALESSQAIASAIAIITTSLTVYFLFERAISGGSELRSTLWRVLSRDYFVDTSQLQIDAAMRLVEGLILLRAAWSAALLEATFAPRAVGASVIGAAAAGAVNVGYLWTAALRRDSPLSTFLSYVATIRFNRQYGDVNAAGSYFVMALFPALGLVVRTKRVAPVVATALIALSVMFSGSRAAVIAGVACAALLAARLAGRLTPAIRINRPGIAVAMIVILGVTGAGVYALLKRNPTSSVGALEIRSEFAQTSLRMLRSQPFFGIGIGEFWHRSGEFSSPALLTRYPQAQHENAHNNFLQLLAELGLVGFAAVMWVLGSAALACARQLGRHPDDWLRWTVCAGLLAFVITWLAGHPMLLDAPAFSFWLLLGVAAGWGSAPPVRTDRRAATIYAAIAITLLAIVSMPARVRAGVARAELEHQGIGLSGWHDGEDGIRYRVAGAESTVFLPSSARVVTIPLRANDPHQQLDVELRLDDRMADVVRVSGERWFMLQLLLPETGAAPRFRHLNLIVRTLPSPAGAPVLKVGKATPR